MVAHTQRVFPAKRSSWRFGVLSGFDAASSFTGLVGSWLAGRASHRRRGWLGAIHPEDRGYAWRQWHETVTHGRPVNAEFRLMKAGKRLALDNVRDAPLRGPDGSVLKWVGMKFATPRRAVRGENRTYRSQRAGLR